MKSTVPAYKITKSNESRPEGICSKFMATIGDNKVMVKNAQNDDVFAERFAYVLGKKLGLHVNEVQISKVGCSIESDFRYEYSSVHYWNESFITKYDSRCMDKPYEGNRKSMLLIEAMHLFDKIMSNTDRHEGNWGYDTSNGYIFMIDHGYCHCMEQIATCRTAEIMLHEIVSIMRSAKTKARGKQNNVFMRVVDRFLAITEDDLNKMVAGLPKDRHGEFKTYAEGTIERMKKMQEIIKTAKRMVM